MARTAPLWLTSLTLICRLSSFFTLPVAHIPAGDLLAFQEKLVEEATYLMLLVFGSFVPWFFILKFDYDPRYRLVNLLFCDVISLVAWALAWCQQFPFVSAAYMVLVLVPLAGHLKLVTHALGELRRLDYPSHVIADAIPMQNERWIHYAQLVTIMVEMACVKQLANAMVIMTLLFSGVLTLLMMAQRQLVWGPELRLINLVSCINGHYGARIIEDGSFQGFPRVMAYYCSILLVFFGFRLVFRDLLKVTGLLR